MSGNDDQKPDKLTVYVPGSLAQRARNAVAHLAGAPLFLSMSTFGETAIRRLVEELEQQHNGGKPFTEPAGKKRPGRPLGS